MKKIAFLFLVALCFITAPVFADSGSWIYGETSGGTSVWGHGEGYVDSYVSGEAGTYSWSGGTYVGLDAGIYGEVSANHGAAITSGGAGGYASAFESRWGGVGSSTVTSEGMPWIQAVFYRNGALDLKEGKSNR